MSTPTPPESPKHQVKTTRNIVTPTGTAPQATTPKAAYGPLTPIVVFLLHEPAVIAAFLVFVLASVGQIIAGVDVGQALGTAASVSGFQVVITRPFITPTARQ